MNREILLADEAATLRFGGQLVRAMPADAVPMILYLYGDLGAGKTTLARGMLQALGETAPVRSPTYALVAEYRPAGQRVLHLDLYRLNSPDELSALGLTDYLPDSRLWMVEWPERAGASGLPPADASLHLALDDGGRRVRFEPHTAAGTRWAAGLGPEAGS